MNTKETSRRDFIGEVLAAGAAGTGCLRTAAFGQAATGAVLPEIRLGGQVHYSSSDPEEMALTHVKLGYRAAYCPSVALDDAGRIKAIEAAFKKHNVVIAEVGRWVNLLDAKPEIRRKNMQQVTDGLALAEAIGALCCVDIVGSYSPTVWMGPHPDNTSARFFDEAVANARTILDAVKPKRAKFCYEMMGWSLPDSPDSALKLLKAVDRDAFAIHLDPCNLINSPERFYRNRELLDECFDKLGPWIVSCHAKDLTWDVEMNIHFREVGPGKGALDFKTYLNRLARLHHRPPLMIEHLSTAQEYDQARQYIIGVAGANGIRIG